MLSIDRNDAEPLYLQVYAQISRGIESGFYPMGKKLPSIRECARELGVSNTTIELAYQKLVEEGYVEARRGSGYKICACGDSKGKAPERHTREYLKAQKRLSDQCANDDTTTRAPFDFSYDAVDPHSFPYISWARISREVFFSEGAEAACMYNDPQGYEPLRAQIARYLNGEFDLACTSAQVFVMPNTRDLVTEVLALHDPQTTVVAMENPGYDEVCRRLALLGFTVREIPTYPYPTWDDMLRILEGTDMVITAPATHFPTNHVMPLEMRRKLVEWAAENDALIIDDEYCCEFQMGSDRIPPLGWFDEDGHVITLGTFSNTFTPAICLSYAVLPPELMLSWRASHQGLHPRSPWQTQAAMALFMKEDHWRAHIRKTRTSAKRKRELIAGALQEHLGNGFEIVMGRSSLFALVQAHDGRSEQELIAAAAKVGARVYPTSQYWWTNLPESWRYVLVGYAGVSAEAIQDGVKALASAWVK